MPPAACTAIQSSDFAFSFFGGTGNNLAACETAMAITGSAPNYVATLSRLVQATMAGGSHTLNLAPRQRQSCVGGASGSRRPPRAVAGRTGPAPSPRLRARLSALQGAADLPQGKLLSCIHLKSPAGSPRLRLAVLKHCLRLAPQGLPAVVFASLTIYKWNKVLVILMG